MSTVQGAVVGSGMAGVGKELSWQGWVKLTSSLQAAENVYKP